jgi:hypothetical protein
MRAEDEAGAGSGTPASRLPRLALVEDGNFPPLEVARVAAGLYEIVWIVNTQRPGVEAGLRAFRRFGAGVVDVAGASFEEAAAAVGALHPDAILTQADDLLVWTARIAERLGLCSMSVAAAERATDKLAQRTALRAHGLPVPDFWPVPSEDEAAAWEHFIASASFPAVLKPRRGWASRDTVAVHSLDELCRALADLSGERRGEMLLEEFLQDEPGAGGPGFASYVSVESLASAGRVSHLAVSGRTPLAEPFRETGAFMPSALEDDDLAAVLETASAAASAVGIETGVLHTEIKLTPAGPRVIEVNGRRGGSLAMLLPIVTGVELLPTMMRLALGEAIVFDELLPTSGVAFRLRRYAPPAIRTILGIEGLDRWRRERPEDEMTVVRGPGDHVDWRNGGDDRVLLVIGVAADHSELAGLVERLGRDVIIHGE